jgi:uncharacterized protein YciI
MCVCVCARALSRSEHQQKFIEADPYVVNGLVTAWKIRDWTAVVGTGQL